MHFHCFYCGQNFVENETCYQHICKCESIRLKIDEKKFKLLLIMYEFINEYFNENRNSMIILDTTKIISEIKTKFQINFSYEFLNKIILQEFLLKIIISNIKEESRPLILENFKFRLSKHDQYYLLIFDEKELENLNIFPIFSKKIKYNIMVKPEEIQSSEIISQDNKNLLKTGQIKSPPIFSQEDIQLSYVLELSKKDKKQNSFEKLFNDFDNLELEEEYSDTEEEFCTDEED